jgi:2,4-dienoyl-CoA reductase-like NADH-dependent reductase (Old Yellow Enzyme family)
MSRDVPVPSAVEALFRPFTIGRLTVSNRIVMAPMTRNYSTDGVPGPDVAAYYARRAEHGVGLIITEGTVVDHPASANSPKVPRFFGDAPLAGWARVVEAVHAAGGRIVPQLWHVGTERKVGDLPNPGVAPVGPSGLSLTGESMTEPMTEAEIDDVVAAFAQGAADAQRLGFDGVELHGAHGYLIDQFFWERTNRRTDRYGGALVARTRFAADIVTACRRAVAPDFPIILRFSQWKIRDFEARLVDTPTALEAFLTPLVMAGVDAFHCSTRRFWLPAFADSPLTLAGWTRKLSGRPTIAVGSVGLDGTEFLDAFLEGKGANNASLQAVVELLERGEADLVAAGRALLTDPAWVEKVRDGRNDELMPFRVEALQSLI